MGNYCVYKHTCPNGKVYIGITCKKPQVRWGKKGQGYYQNKHFTNAIKKYGWNNIGHEILYSGLTHDEACTKEVELIAKYNSTDREFGYNHTTGGDCGFSYNMSNEHREKMRKRITKKNREVKQIDIETNKVIAIYISTKEAERQTGINHVSICNACNGKYKTAGGYKWEYGGCLKQEKPKKPKKKKKPRNKYKIGSYELHNHLRDIAIEKGRAKQVEQYDKDTGELVCVYQSIQDVRRINGYNDSAIIRACQGKQHTSYGYVWKYKNI